MSARNFSNEAQFVYDIFNSLTFRIGGSMDILSFLPSVNEKHSLEFALEALHPRSYPERVNLGFEYSFRKLGHLRAGYLLQL